MSEPEMQSIVERLRAFAAERDWQQYHDPKNLAMLIASEAGELAAQLRWVSNTQSDAYVRASREAVEDELADVAIGILLFCDRTGIDLWHAVRRKIEKNRAAYPAQDARGVPDRPRG